MNDGEPEPDTFELGYECIPGESWQYTAGVLRYAFDRTVDDLNRERECSADLTLQVMNLRDQLNRANATIDKLTEAK